MGSTEPEHGARLRQPPVERFAGAEHVFDLAQEGARLRGEEHRVTNGHRQIVLFREDPVSVLLFGFEAGGTLSDHVAEGVVVIHVVSGQISVRTSEEEHALSPGGLLVLRPGVRHDLTALVASDVLVSINLMPA